MPSNTILLLLSITMSLVANQKAGSRTERLIERRIDHGSATFWNTTITKDVMIANRIRRMGNEYALPLFILMIFITIESTKLFSKTGVEVTYE